MRGKWCVILHRHHCLEYHHSLSWHQASLFLGTPPMSSTAGWQLGSMGRGGCCGIHPGPPPMHRPKLPMLLVQQKRKQRRRRSHPGLSCTRRSYCSMDGSLLGKDRKIEALHLPPHSDCHIGHFFANDDKDEMPLPFYPPPGSADVLLIIIIPGCPLDRRTAADYDPPPPHCQCGVACQPPSP